MCFWKRKVPGRVWADWTQCMAWNLNLSLWVSRAHTCSSVYTCANPCPHVFKCVYMCHFALLPWVSAAFRPQSCFAQPACFLSETCSLQGFGLGDWVPGQVKTQAPSTREQGCAGSPLSSSSHQQRLPHFQSHSPMNPLSFFIPHLWHSAYSSRERCRVTQSVLDMAILSESMALAMQRLAR